MAHENTAATPRVDPALRVPLLTAVVGMVAAAAFGFVLPSMLAVPVAVLVMGLAVLSALVALDMHRRLQADALARNVEASNLWAFFQAKTIRGTMLRTAAEGMEVDLAGVTDTVVRERMQKRVDDWKKTIARYDSEPESNEGRKELAIRAKAMEAERDLSKAKNEKFEISSGMLQIAIVITSASIITGIGLLAWLGGLMGALALGLMMIGLFAPLSFMLH